MVLHHLWVIDHMTLPGITDGQLKTKVFTHGLRKIVVTMFGAQRNKVIQTSHIYPALLENLDKEHSIIFVLMLRTVTKSNQAPL